jgi:hypothetical protein
MGGLAKVFKGEYFNTILPWPKTLKGDVSIKELHFENNFLENLGGELLNFFYHFFQRN